MAVVFLDSGADQRLAPYRDLSRPAVAGDQRRFVVEGRFLVERLLASRFTTESILTDARRAATLPAEIAESTDIYVLPAESINQLVGFEFHRGMLACGLRRRLPAVAELLPTAPASSASLLMVVASQVADPANLGGILRNCAGFGANAVLLGPGCADPFSRRVLRASMGAGLQLAIATSVDLTADLRRLTGQHGVTLVATVLDQDAEPLARLERSGRVALVIGNEGFGLSDEVIGICQRKATIPLQPGVDSLNAAVASGIFLYHFSRGTSR